MELCQCLTTPAVLLKSSSLLSSLFVPLLCRSSFYNCAPSSSPLPFERSSVGKETNLVSFYHYDDRLESNFHHFISKQEECKTLQ